MTFRWMPAGLCFLTIQSARAAELPGPVRELAGIAFGEQEGKGYRIPAIVRTKSERLSAFCEQRVGQDYHAQNDIAMKSGDYGGKTWGALHKLAHEFGNCLIDPRAVVLEGGRVILIYKRDPQGIHARNPVHTKMAELGCASKDEGETWKSVAWIQAGGFACSCLVVLTHGDVGCFYEGEECRKINFAIIPNATVEGS